MIQKNRLTRRLALFGIGLSLLLTTTPVYALDSPQPSIPQHPAKADSSVSAKKQNKLDDNRRKVCERRVEAIRNIARRVADRGESQLDLLDKISSRTQNFYTTKKLSVPNYSQLVGSIAAKRAIVVADIHKVRTGTNLDCSGDDPKAQGQVIKANIQTMQDDIHQYRTAVRNLVTAVRAAAK